MNKSTKIITIAFGIVGSILLCTGLIISAFSIDMTLVNKRADVLYNISLPFLFSFFMASSFIFTKKNITYIITRALNAFTIALAVALITLDVKDLNPNLVFVVITGSLLFYNICDLLFRKIKLPQIFVVVPMCIFFIYEIANFNKDNKLSILIGTIGTTLLFVLHLIIKSLPIFKEEEKKVMEK